MRRSIEWLGDKGEARRYAAALILCELAENAPAVFNVHVRAFIDAVWNGLRDPKQLVREASVTALRVGCSLMQIAWHHLHGDFRLHGSCNERQAFISRCSMLYENGSVSQAELTMRELCKYHK